MFTKADALTYLDTAIDAIEERIFVCRCCGGEGNCASPVGASA